MKTTEEIRTDILIAEFIGGEVIGPGIPTDVILPNGKMVGIDELEYSTSMDCLMQAVKKMESMGYDIVSGTNYVSIHPPYGTGRPTFRYVYTSENRNERHKILYNAIVGFIEWKCAQ